MDYDTPPKATHGELSAVQLNSICENFEVEYRSGNCPVIEDFLQKVPKPLHESLLAELLAIEIELSAVRTPIKVGEYYRRFPNDEEIVEKVVQSHIQGIRETEVSGDQSVPQINNYKLLEQIGEGGFGTVWVADQRGPVRRRVAVKVIKPGMDTRQVVARFEAERQALALMDHPNIAKVLDAGSTSNGRPFFAMDLVDGIAITKSCDQHSLTLSNRVELLVNVCHGVQHAHQKGVIHRDLKPSNVLVYRQHECLVPKIIDFGIAKATQLPLTEKTIYTQVHQFIGTPHYVSPEQVDMRNDVDTRSDIYSLGVLLYELLVGRPPFDLTSNSQNIDEMRRVIRTQEPLKPSTMLGSLPRDHQIEMAKLRSMELAKVASTIAGDLDWICMKCLEKERSRRYETAEGLAEDLQRFLRREPVNAHPPTLTYRLSMLARQHRAVIFSTVVVVLALLSATLISIRYALSARDARIVEYRLRQKEAALRYAAEINIAFDAVQDNNLTRARELLIRQRFSQGSEDHRGFEWRLLWQLCRSEERASFASRDQAVELSSDGKSFATCGRNYTEIRNSSTFDVVRCLPNPGQLASSASFSPDNAHLAVASDKEVAVWDCETWTCWKVDGKEMCEFSKDGRFFCTATENGFAIWDPSTWSKSGCVGALPVNLWPTRNVLTFSKDGSLLVTPNYNTEIRNDWFRVWKLPEMKPLDGFQPEGRPLASAAAFLSNGEKLVTGLWDGQIVLWDVQSGRKVSTIGSHNAWISDIVLSPDENTFASTSADRVINVWDASNYRQIGKLRGHSEEVVSLAYSGDGQTLVSLSKDTLKIWQPPHLQEKEETFDAGEFIAGFSSDSRVFVMRQDEGANVIDIASGKTDYIPMKIPRPPSVFEFLSNAMTTTGTEPIVVAGSHRGKVHIWDLNKRVELGVLKAHEGPTDFVTICPNHKLFATGTRLGEVAVWDFVNQTEVDRFSDLGVKLWHLSFSPVRKTLALAAGNDVILREVGSTHAITLKGHDHLVSHCVFSPDGTIVASSSFDNSVGIWNSETGKLLTQLRGHVTGVNQAAFSPDGKTIATTAGDQKLKLWNVDTYQELATLKLGWVAYMQFSPDGTMLALVTLNGKKMVTRILRAPSWKEIRNLSGKSPH